MFLIFIVSPARCFIRCRTFRGDHGITRHAVSPSRHREHRHKMPQINMREVSVKDRENNKFVNKCLFQRRELSRFEPGGHLGVLFACTGRPVFGRMLEVLQECRAIEHVAC